MFTGTNSVMYKMKTEDVYEDFNTDKKMLNFSYYSTGSKYYDHPKKSVVGKMKDEGAGAAIKEFVGLKAKMHFW